MMGVGWPALCGPPVEGSTMSLLPQVLHRFGSAFSEACGVLFGIYVVFSFNRPVIFPSFSPGIASPIVLPGT